MQDALAVMHSRSTVHIQHLQGKSVQCAPLYTPATSNARTLVLAGITNILHKLNKYTKTYKITIIQ